MLASFKHAYADVGGVRLHYVTAGQGPAVVLLHGWPQTWYMWRNVIPGLATRCRVIAPDLRGLGDSSRPRDGYDKKTLAQDVWRLVHDVLQEQRLFVAGHDWGGPTAFALAVHGKVVDGTMRQLFLLVSLCVALNSPSASFAADPPQTPVRMALVHPGAAEDKGMRDEVFWTKLRALGWEEGRNLKVERRFARGRMDAFPGYMEEIIKGNPDIIVTAANPGVLAARKATATIPIVAVIMGRPCCGWSCLKRRSPWRQRDRWLLASQRRHTRQVVGVVASSGAQAIEGRCLVKSRQCSVAPGRAGPETCR